MPAIEHGLQSARNYGGAFVLGIHSFDKLVATYGLQNATALTGLARTKLILATADRTTAEKCSEFIGSREVRQMDEAYITTRELPDGRHAFRARKSDQAAKDALSAACKGVGQWNPLYQNWIVPADRAPAIRAAIEAALSDHAGTDNTSAPVTRGDGAKNREVIV